MTEQELAEKIRQRYGTGTYRPPLRILFDGPVQHERTGPSLMLAVLLLMGAAGVGFWVAIGLLWELGWINPSSIP